MSTFDYDLFVIGAGSGGVRAARISAELGARVAIAENSELGGTCVNVGCVPKKLFFYATHFADEFKNAVDFGWSTDSLQFDWSMLIKNKNTEIKRLNNIYGDLLKTAGVDLLIGHAKILNPHTIQIGAKICTAERILIASGSWPYVPNIPGKQLAISSNEAFFLEKLPQRIIIVGGGYIGVEFAGIFNAIGVDTTLLYRGDLFLKGFDDDIRQFLATEMQQKGIFLQFNTSIESIKKSGQALQATLTDGTQQIVDLIMYATGRRPKTAGIGLENVGVKLDKNAAIIVNQQYQSNISSIYAIGDVSTNIKLTPVALAEATFLAHNFYGTPLPPLDYNNIPTCVFSQPPIASVGMTEAQARQQYPNIAIYRSTFTPLKLTLAHKKQKNMMKMIVNKNNDRVLGVHIVAADAGEIIQGIAVAIKAGATKTDFDKTIAIHPTSAEELVTMRTPLATL